MFFCLPAKEKKQKRDLFYFVVGLGHHAFAYTFWRVTAVPLQKGWLSLRQE